MELLMIRHGATAGNLERRYIGTTNEPLSVQGIASAKELAPFLPDVEGVWSSPMVRCIQTAALLFPGKSPHIMPDLRECDFGAFEGKTWSELSCEKRYRDWAANAGKDFYFPDGERYSDFLRRSRRGVRQCVDHAFQLGCSRCAIVAHGGTIMAAMSAYVSEAQNFYHWQVQPCGGYLISIQEEDFTFKVIQGL